MPVPVPVTTISRPGTRGPPALRRECHYIGEGFVKGRCIRVSCLPVAAVQAEQVARLQHERPNLVVAAILAAELIEKALPAAAAEHRQLEPPAEHFQEPGSLVRTAGGEAPHGALQGVGRLRQREPVPPVQGVLGAALRVGAFIPAGTSYAGNPGGAGLALDLSYWFEADHFAIEARAGARFDVVAGPASYVEVPLDFGMFWLLSSGDAVPFLGGGIGYRYLWEKQARTITTGAILPATTNVIKEDEGSAPGAYLRAGLLLGRTRGGRIALAAEYSAIFATVNGYRAPRAMTLGTTFIF